MNFIERVFAQPKFPDLTTSIIKPDAFQSVGDVIYFIVKGLLILAGAIAVIYIIYSGFQFLTSAGDPEKAQRARSGLIYAVIGIIVIALSYFIVGAVTDLLKK